MPKTTDEQTKEAQEEVAKWSEEKRQSVQLEGTEEYSVVTGCRHCGGMICFCWP